jgi:hypothetical protein
MKTHFCLIMLLIAGMPVQLIRAQPTAGITGMLNTPTARMQPDGTLTLGGTWLPAAIMPEKLKFNTGNYYVNLTFLPFLEVSYRCTLLKMPDGGYHNQDRSIALKGRLLRERRLLPSVVAGGNDIYSSAEKGNRYFKTCYVAAGKHFSCAKAHIHTSLGYGFKTSGSERLTGLFGGISLSPGFAPSLECMAEYDSKAFNTGVSLTFFHHLQIVVFAYELRHFTGCLMYKICL